MKLVVDGHPFDVSIARDVVTVDGVAYPFGVETQVGLKVVTVGGRRFHVEMRSQSTSSERVLVDGGHHSVSLEAGPASVPRRRERAVAPVSSVPGGLAAAMAGRVLKVNVTAGDTVVAGAVLLTLEAMKMENEIHAPRDGTIKELRAKPGDRVNAGDLLLVIE